MGLFCGDIGLLGRNIRVLCGEVGLFCANIGSSNHGLLLSACPTWKNNDCLLSAFASGCSFDLCVCVGNDVEVPTKLLFLSTSFSGPFLSALFALRFRFLL